MHSAPVSITVSPEASTTTLSVLSFDTLGNIVPFISQPYGNSAFFRADVAGLSNNGTATGSVTFTDNAANITGDPFNLNSEATAGTAQGIFTMAPGSHDIVAHYGGDPGFNASISSTVKVTVTQAPTTTAVVSSSGSVAQGTLVTLTATVNTTSGGLRPGGTVTFLSGGTPITNSGNPVPVGGTDGSANIQNASLQPAQGIASLATTLPTTGQNSITAQYSGDANYTGSTAAAVIVNVFLDFSFTSAAPAITIASPGGSGTAVLTITGQPGYNGTVSFTAMSCSGLPSESTCSFSPASVTGSGSTTLTIATTAAHRASLEGSGWWTTSVGATLAGVLLLGGASRRRTRSRLFSLIAFAFLITIGGCGGGGSGGGGNNDPGTPVGSSMVTVTATSGTITHTTTVTLNVQ